MDELSSIEKAAHLAQARKQWQYGAYQAQVDDRLAKILNDDNMKQAANANLRRALMAMDEIDKMLAEIEKGFSR